MPYIGYLRTLNAMNIIDEVTGKLPGGLPDGGDLHLWALPKGQHPSGASG